MFLECSVNSHQQHEGISNKKGTRLRRRSFVLVVALLLPAACQREAAKSPELKQLQQRQVGEYIVAALHETGQLRQGTARLVLEFRRASDQQLANVGDIQVSAAMPMPGMPDMFVDTSATRTDQAGRYEVQSNLSMAGTYRVNVKFAAGQQVQFELQVT